MAGSLGCPDNRNAMSETREEGPCSACPGSALAAPAADSKSLAHRVPSADSSRGEPPGNTRGDPRVDHPTGAFPAKVKGAPHVARMPSEVVVDEFENPAGRRGLRSFARLERAGSRTAN